MLRIVQITVLRILPKASRIRLNKLFRMLFKAFRILLIKVFRSALWRDRLFDDGDVGGFNAGGGDWLLALTSDTEGDEDSILQDESDDEVGDDDLVVNVDGESDDGGAVELDKVPVAFELTRGGLDRLEAEEWDVYMEQEAGRVLHDALPLYDRPSDPTRAALAYAEDHLPSVTSSCSRNSGGALEWKRTSIAETALMPLPKQMRFRVLQRRETAPSTSGLSVEEYQTKLARKSAVQPHENVRFVGLLVAKALEPRQHSLSHHWITRAEGALSCGSFGQFMSRDRFHDIARYFHFNDNDRQGDSDDRAFKIRFSHPCFARDLLSWIPPWRRDLHRRRDGAHAASSQPDASVHAPKPNKWGTKFYLTCCAETAYCTPYGIVLLRISVALEVCCGKANKSEVAVAQEAVVENIAKVLRGQPTQRRICTDNFYTSSRFQTSCSAWATTTWGRSAKNRNGWCKAIEFKQKKRQKRCQEESIVWRFGEAAPSFKLLAAQPRSRKFLVESLVVRSPVCHSHSLHVTIMRPSKGGGVDVHDQLRLQRYSIQRAIQMRKYYKTNFLGIVDIAMVNAFIIHKLAMRSRGRTVPTHAVVMRRLHIALLDQLLLPNVHQGKEGHTLCNKARRQQHGSILTCNQIWHQSWRNGMTIPPELQHKIRFVDRRRREIFPNDDVEDDDNERKDAVVELLKQSVEGVPQTGAIKEIADKFGVDRKTLSRLWKPRTGTLRSPSNRHQRGRPNKDLSAKLERLRNIPLAQRSTLRSASAVSGVARTTLHRRIQSGQLVAHVNTVKPLLMEVNKASGWGGASPTSKRAPCISTTCSIRFMWTKKKYLTEVRRRYYLLPEEPIPIRHVCSTHYITKVMMLAAVARSRLDPDSRAYFDGKLRIWPFIEQKPAVCSSRRRPTGTLVTMEGHVNQENYRNMLIQQLVPAIREKWPFSGRGGCVRVQQDNAPAHIDTSDQRFATAVAEQGLNVQLCFQPPNSPDLNCLNLSLFSAIQARQRLKCPTTMDELIEAVADSYWELPPSKLNVAFLSLQYSMDMCIKGGGGNAFKPQHMAK
ncbi:hypothetical protein PPTG_21137 [Phytophthora nicotianae INRA-310]|uniref:PiggyBac transposable element-derived protein domain-containing protein n=1 Tax=Phytophthora nicotianae (strain INRA-310) TaxID=761204 RepID=W2R987_PHYN3|nr:hypothetical protein PPTG_21137 [Phytophthora nicotianae INRA-310]ETN21771.1 hypothetical protein PPTG_21137 [Phytophthora nicotianae INRA-310]